MDEVEMLLFQTRHSLRTPAPIWQTFRELCRILNQQVRHYAHGSHFVKTASHEVQQFLIAAFLNGIGAGFELIRHFFYAVQQRLHFFAARESAHSRAGWRHKNRW